jgi:hypothetical protein
LCQRQNYFLEPLARDEGVEKTPVQLTSISESAMRTANYQYFHMTVHIRKHKQGLDQKI